jgi:hypothetical protein
MEKAVCVMMILLKILAAPIVAILTLATAFCSFVLSVAGFFFWLASAIVFILSAVTLLMGEIPHGIAWMVVAFLISPFGLPALAGWLVGRLDDFNFAVRGWIYGR